MEIILKDGGGYRVRTESLREHQLLRRAAGRQLARAAARQVELRDDHVAALTSFLLDTGPNDYLVAGRDADVHDIIAFADCLGVTLPQREESEQPMASAMRTVLRNELMWVEAATAGPFPDTVPEGWAEA